MKPANRNGRTNHPAEPLPANPSVERLYREALEAVQLANLVLDDLRCREARLPEALANAAKVLQVIRDGLAQGIAHATAAQEGACDVVLDVVGSRLKPAEAAGARKAVALFLKCHGEA